MPLQRANVIAVACNVPGCKCADQFLLPHDLQATGWLEVFRLGDSSTHLRAYICPEHAKPLNLGGNFEETPDANTVEQGFTRIGGVPFPHQVFPEMTPQLRNLLTGGNSEEPKQLPNGKPTK